MSVASKLPEKIRAHQKKLSNKIFHEKCEAFPVDGSLYSAEKGHEIKVDFRRVRFVTMISLFIHLLRVQKIAEFHPLLEKL